MIEAALVVPLRIAVIAQMIGWTKRRALRHLRARERAGKSAALVLVGNCWMTTLAAVREAWPEFGDKLATAHSVDAIAQEVERQGRELRIVARSILAVDRKSETRIKCLESRIEACERTREAWPDTGANRAIGR